MRDRDDTNDRVPRKFNPSPSAPASPSLPGFRDYCCGNEACVLSRFERFSMAFAPDPCCPICGWKVPEHGSASVAN